jgi:hypothetical protein
MRFALVLLPLVAIGCVTAANDNKSSGTAPGAASAIQPHDGPINGHWREWVKPAPQDQPQPKFFCAKGELTADPVWLGSVHTFAWEVANEGRAPLKMHVDT